MLVGDQKRKFVCLETVCFVCVQKQWCFVLDYSECSKCYRIYNIETLIVDESINIWFDDKLVSGKTKQLNNFCRYSFILSEVAEQRSKSPEAVYIRSNGSEDQVAASVENLRISEEPTVRRSPRLASAHLEDVILGKKDDSIRTRSFLKNDDQKQ